LGEHLQFIDDRKIILESSLDLSKFYKLHFKAHLKYRSLFIATWSLSEMSLIDRKQILQQLLGFNVIFITFFFQFDGIDNVIFFRNYSYALQDKGYSTCSWRIPKSPKNFFFVARLRGIADQNNYTDTSPTTFDRIACSRAVGCNRATFLFGDCTSVDESADDFQISRRALCHEVERDPNVGFAFNACISALTNSGEIEIAEFMSNDRFEVRH